MDDTTLKKTAIALLERRNRPNGIQYYVETQWRRQAFFLTIWGVLIGCAFSAGYHLIAVGVLGFAVGRTVRDVRWWRVLSAQWPTTVELIDWAKVESLAE